MTQNHALSPKAANRLSRLHLTLRQIHNGQRRVSVSAYRSLTRQMRRIVSKVCASPYGVAKACGAMAIALLLSGNAESQCNTFVNADAVNPLVNRKTPTVRKPVYVDIDADGDLDCYAPRYVYYYSNPLFFKNTGTNAIPGFVYKPGEGGGFSTGLYDLDFAPTTVQFADIDGDGDYDCFMSEAYNGSGEVHMRYYENQGSATEPHFVENAAKNPLSRSYGFYFLDFTLADIDSDGDIDAYTFNWFTAEVLENKGTKTNPAFVVKESKRNASAGERIYYDWNHDGLTDYFEDRYDHVDYYRNIGPANDPKYVLDNGNAPQFNNGFPHSLADVNGDGSLEGFNSSGGYFTMAPVPRVDSSAVVVGGKTYTRFTIGPSGSGYSYQAYRNGMPVKGATFKTFIAPVNGIYSFTVTDSCGTGISLPYKVKYDSSASGILAKNGQVIVTTPTAKATVYPNPFTGYIVLQLPAGTSTGMVQVADLQGKVLLNQLVSSGTVRLGENLAKGIYFLKLIQGGQVVFTQKLVKQ